MGLCYQFSDKDKIAGACTNEGITLFRVVFYLAFVVVGQNEFVVAYEGTLAASNYLFTYHLLFTVCERQPECRRFAAGVFRNHGSSVC